MLSHEGLNGAHSERSLGSLGEAVVSLMKRVEKEREGESLKKKKKKRDGLSASKKMSGILFRLQDSAYESDRNTDSHSGIFHDEEPSRLFTNNPLGSPLYLSISIRFVSLSLDLAHSDRIATPFERCSRRNWRCAFTDSTRDALSPVTFIIKRQKPHTIHIY
jgi:hypothetical protein